MNPKKLSRFTGWFMLVSIAISGCNNAPPIESDNTANTANSNATEHRKGTANLVDLPVISGAELETLIRQSSQPVLVEFGVDFACHRCDQMKPQIIQLAQQFKGQAKIVRVDFNANHQTAIRYGATICPSYVIFDKTRPVRTRGFPTSADLLSLDLESVLEPKDSRF